MRKIYISVDIRVPCDILPLMPRKTKKEKGNILIIDDDKAILSTMRDLLESEGYAVYTADEGEKGLACIENLSPDLILLDVWLPHIDGLMLLSKIKEKASHIPVVMMSGHAGIETAVRATKLGAADFIEKPFSLEKILSILETFLTPVGSQYTEVDDKEEKLTHDEERLKRSALLRKNHLNQRTIAKSVVCNGQGLFSGKKVGLQMLPAPPNTGIKFIDLTSGSEIPLHPSYLYSAHVKNPSSAGLANSTSLTNGTVIARTIEHLLAALHAFSITNLYIKIDEEIPNTDGSSIDFCKIIEEAEVIEQEGKILELQVEERLEFGDIENEDAPSMILTPSDCLDISLSISFEPPIGKQSLRFVMKEPNDFIKEIASARSFNTLDNIDMAQKVGRVGSGMISSHIIIHDGKIINTELKYEDEFVRHKILDIIGDLYLLGHPLKAKIEANRTSHVFNHEVISELALLHNL